MNSFPLIVLHKILTFLEITNFQMAFSERSHQTHETWSKSGTKHQLENPKFKNWVKCAIGLSKTKSGMATYVNVLYFAV